MRKKETKTVLIFCEGDTEKNFAEYLRFCYKGETDTKIKLKNGKGGSPKMLVQKAQRVPGDFDKIVVILDTDRSELKEARALAKDRGIQLIEHNPCIEKVFLMDILDSKNFPGRGSSTDYKEAFKGAFGSKTFSNIFPKNLLDTRRSFVPELDALITIMEEGI